MTTLLRSTQFPLVTTVPLSWTWLLQGVTIPAQTLVQYEPIVPDFLNNPFLPSTTEVETEPVIGYEEVYAFNMIGAGTTNSLICEFSCDGGILWFPLYSATLNETTAPGTTTANLTSLGIRVFPAFSQIRYAIENTEVTPVVVTSALTLRAR